MAAVAAEAMRLRVANKIRHSLGKQKLQRRDLAYHRAVRRDMRWAYHKGLLSTQGWRMWCRQCEGRRGGRALGRSAANIGTESAHAPAPEDQSGEAAPSRGETPATRRV